jgi:hypothetical protein
MVRIRKYHYALETLVTSHLSQIIRIVASGVTSNITPLHGRRTSDHQFVRVPLGEAPTSPLVDSPWVQSRDLTAVTSPVTVNKVVLFCNPNQPSNCISVTTTFAQELRLAWVRPMRYRWVPWVSQVTAATAPPSSSNDRFALVINVVSIVNTPFWSSDSSKNRKQMRFEFVWGLAGNDFSGGGTSVANMNRWWLRVGSS